MLTACELRGDVVPGLRGSKRVVRNGAVTKSVRDVERKRAQRWYLTNRDKHLARQRAYAKMNRASESKRAAKWRADNPERARQSARVRSARALAKKRAAIQYMAIQIAFATLFGGAQ